MRIGILTFFSSINNGAFLQAYGLQEYLKQRYGSKVCVRMINYISSKSWEFYGTTGEERRENFYKCWKKLDLTEKRLISDDLDQISEFIKECAFDVVIVGSDEVWKTDGIRGFPTAYWLNFDIGGAVRTAYAASGRNDYDIISNEYAGYIAESLERFRYIGVRDDITREEILRIKKFDVHMNCDPSILHRNAFRFGREEKKNLRKKWVDGDKKLIVLMIQNRELSKLLYRMMRNENTVYDYYEWAGMTDRDILSISPFEWSELIAAADFVITSLFHGTVFSMIHDTPFISIEFAECGRGKIENLLLEHSLQDNMFYAGHYENSLQKLGMDIFTNCRRMLRNGLAVEYENILEEEERKAGTFTRFLDDLIDRSVVFPG